MGPDKSIIFNKLKLNRVLQRGADWQQKIWDDYVKIDGLVRLWDDDMVKRNVTYADIQQLTLDWLTHFIQPGVGRPSHSGYVPGHYNRDDITPYMHMLMCHFPEFIQRHGSLEKFSSAVTERCNGVDGRAFFGCTSRRVAGGEALKELLTRRLRLLVNPQAALLSSKEVTCSCPNCGKGYCKKGWLDKHVEQTGHVSS